MICSKCGQLMDMTDKDSSSGRVFREYLCRKCGHTDWEDGGVALWQALEDLNEQSEAKEAAARASATSPASPEPAAAASPEAKKSKWQRFVDLFRWGR